MNENTDLPDKNQQAVNLESVPSTDPLPAASSITGNTITETSPKQKTKEMEVHHHGHVHEKKKWKEYVFQFVMLFAAVFLGSYAETKREDIIEKHREKEYMESMVEDIKKDTAQLRQRYSFIFTQIEKIDTLQTLFSHNLANNNDEVDKCYELSYFLLWYSAVAFNERTISQLIGSGNMRIIKGKNAADSIMEYYNAIKTIDVQKQQYVYYLNLTLAEMYNVFDVSYLRKEMNKSDSLLYWTNANWKGLHLLTTDPAALRKLSATLETTKFVIHNYMGQLGAINQKAARLILFLRERYSLKSE